MTSTSYFYFYNELSLVNDPDTDEISYSASLGVQPVPEPSSVLGIVALSGIFAGSALQRQRKKRKQQLSGLR